jgi:hypothetical protein
MPRQKGEATKVVRVPVRLIEHLQPEADRLGVGVGEVIARRLLPREQALEPKAGRCSCDAKKVKLSSVVSNLCTNCGRLR